jgi:hypothetical protein
MVDIAIATGIHELTHEPIRKQDDKIDRSRESAARMIASKTIQTSSLIMEKLERMLAEWMKH